jgi:flagellar biosynthesis protein FlhF
MQIRKYTVKNMKEAIAEVKGDLGKDAVILASRTVRGKSGQAMLEVTAAVDYDADALRKYDSRNGTQNAAPKVNAPAQPALENGLSRILQELRSVDARLSGLANISSVSDLSEKIDSMWAFMQEIKEPQARPGNQPLFDGEALRLYSTLLNSGVPTDLASDLMSETILGVEKDQANLDDCGANILAQALMERIPLADNQLQGRRVCALVGPTGTGKTTTIAKLAAMERFNHQRKIGFITIDTFRIGAVDQLRTYAGILKTPVEVAVDAQDLVRKVEGMPNVDTVFIDTTGISPRDEEMMNGLNQYFQTDLDLEAHLVLSASTRLGELTESAKRFSRLPLTSIIVSKIDEVSHLGNIAGFINEQEMPLSYFTTGQGVPEDLEEATRERIADMVLGISSAT